MDNKKSRFNGPVIRRLGEILQDSDGLLTLVKLNILFIFTFFPFLPPVSAITGGGALSALSCCCLKLVRTGYLPDVKETYFTFFKNSFKKNMKNGSISVILSAVLIFDVYYYLLKSGGNIMYAPVASFALLGLIVLWSASVHIFSAEKTVTLSEIFRTVSERMGKTIVAVVFTGVFLLILTLLLPSSLPIILTFGFSVPALACAFAAGDPEW